MSLEQAITDHAAALLELAAAIRSTISGAHGVTAATDKVISDAKKAEVAKPAAAKEGEAKKPVAQEKPVTQEKPTESKPEAGPASSDAIALDYEAVKAKALQLSKEKGRDPLVSLLQRHGATKAPELKEEQYGAFIADVDAILAGTYDPETAELA